jgi:hypothetical protein
MEELLKVYRWLKRQKRLLKFLYWKLVNIGYYFGFLSVVEIPIVINNFNRLSFLVQLVDSLRRCGYRKIIVLDNQSTFPPLLAYYKTSDVEVVNLDKNYGYLALWKSGYYNRIRWNYFVYTDSDVLPIDACPVDFLSHFKKKLDGLYSADKVGFGIKIDDLPDYFSFRNKVSAHENKFWKHEVAPGLYKAQIDTTFALYKPLTGLKFGETSTLEAYRTGFPFLIRHLPWYNNSSALSEEEKYYIKTSNESSGISRQIKSGDVY